MFYIFVPKTDALPNIKVLKSTNKKFQKLQTFICENPGEVYFTVFCQHYTYGIHNDQLYWSYL